MEQELVILSESSFGTRTLTKIVKFRHAPQGNARSLRL